MKIMRGGAGRFPERPYFSDREIEKLCVDELRKVGLYPSHPGPVRIERFIEKRFKVSPTYADLPDGVLGFTKFDANGVREIVIAASLEGPEGTPTERRLRATLAHEGGHGLMHAHLFALGTKPASLFGDGDSAPKILCRDMLGETQPTHGYDGRWWELQANKAIGGLLMPRSLVEEAIRSFTAPLGSLGQVTIPETNRDAAVRELANIFNVNPVVARIRLADIFPAEESGQLTL
jgi:hypothetical protein